MQQHRRKSAPPPFQHQVSSADPPLVIATTAPFGTFGMLSFLVLSPLLREQLKSTNSSAHGRRHGEGDGTSACQRRFGAGEWDWDKRAHYITSSHGSSALKED